VRQRQALLWAGIAALVVLATRMLAYALVPQTLLVEEFEQQTGNPHVLAATLVGLGLAAFGSLAMLALAVVAVRERLALEGRRLAATPRLRPGLLALRFAALFAVTSVGFAYLESYIHWREGLGWHGLHCLIGPVHRDAIPILAALSALAVALHGACELLLAYARRLALAFLPQSPHAVAVIVATPAEAAAHGRTDTWTASPRGPPPGGFVLVFP
jgi:hypothetical protein